MTSLMLYYIITAREGVAMDAFD